MNKAYKIIWSHARKCYVVVSEIAKNRGKNNVRAVLDRMASVAAGGALLAMLAAPAAWAQNIEKVSGAKFNDTVNHIYADKVVNSAAVNAFKHFELDQGRIANMYMGTQSAPNAASSLVNFVNNQASISGTVNAIRNGAIGGNLYFLSPNGVVVGASGAINAGSVHLMAPSQSEYNAMVGGSGVNDTAFSQRWSKIQDGSIALNAEATITVAGKIHAVDGIGIHAGSVNIKTGAALTSSDALDFANLVNVSGASAGLGGNLKLQKANESGKIVLAAKADSGTTSDWTNIKLTPAVTVAEGAAVSAAGDVSITAEAKNEEAFVIGTVKATVNANGAITGNNVKIASKAEDVFVTNGGDHIASLQNMFTGSGSYDLLGAAADVLRTLSVDTVAAVHDVKAETNIGKNAVIKATGADPTDGKALSITADSTLTAGMATSPDGIVGDILNIVNDRKIHSKLRTGAQSTSVAVGKLDNAAIVNVEGKLETTQGGVKAAATANASPTISAVDSLTKTENSALMLGVGVLTGTNTSETNLKNSANLQNIKGEFAASANATEKISLKAGVKSSNDNAMAGTAVAVMDYDSSARLSVDTGIKAGAVKLSSDNTITANKLTASNSIGASTVSGENVEQSLLTSSSKYIGNLKNSLVDGIFSKLGGGKTETASPLFEEASQLFNAGASVAVASQTNTAKTILTKNANIEATGDVKVTSDLKAENTHMYASGSTGNAPQKKIDENNKESVQKVKIQASVLVADIDSEAQVEIEDGTEANHARISGGNVTLASTSDFTHALDNLLDDFDTIEKGIKDLQDTGLSEDWAALATAVNNYRTDVGTVGDIAPAAMKVLETLKKYPDAFTSIGPKITAFLKVENYANFSVSSATEGGSDKNPSYSPTRDLSKDNAKLAIAGAVDVALTDDGARVSLGKYTDIKGTGTTAVKASLDRTDSSLNGNLGLQTGDQNAVGGVVSVFKADRHAGVTMAEGAAVSGNTLSLDAASHTNHVDLATGASMGGDTGVKGMVTYVAGDNTAKVDVAGNTKLTSAGAMSLTADNTAGLTNIAGSFGFGAATGVGASIAVNDMEVDSAVNVGKANAGQVVINAGSLKATSDLGGTVNSVAIAGGIASASDEDEAGGIAKLTTKLMNTKNKVANVWRNANDKLNSIVPETIRKAADIKENKKLKTDNVAKNPNANKKLSELSIAGAGSVALNLLDRTAHTVIDGAAINLSGSDRKVALKATDSGFTGAWAGAAGITFNTRKAGGDNENSTNVGVAGSVGWTALETDTVSAIRNSRISKAAAITNEAERSGAVVSAGLGMALATSGQAEGGSSYTGAASVSVADMDNTVKAELTNNTVTDSGSVKNTVTDSDTLVTGGVNASIAAGKSKSAAVGGSMVYNRVKNQMDALVTGGSYALTGDLENRVSTGITEVGGAVGLALATSSGGGKSYGFEGAVAYNSLTNTANAVVDGATITAKNVTVDARDTKDVSKKYDEYISERGLDADGRSYAEAIEDALDEEGKANISSTGGNIIVGAALSAAASLGESGSAAVDAALSISEVDNDFTASVKNNSVITGSGILNVKADSKTLAIGAAAGGGGTSDGFGGAGSFSWQTDANDVTAEISGSTVKGMSGNIVNATTAAKDINVAGQVAVGNVAVGLAGAYNRLENTTGAYVKNSQFADNTAKTLSIGAKNEGRVYAVTAGVSASREKLAANGAVAVNSGADNIRAELSGGAVKNAASISVTSEDDTKKLAVAGGFTLSKGTAIGGAVAYNAIGDTARQVNSASIKNATIENTTSKIHVSATDTSGLTTVGFGVGLSSGSPAVNGAAAVGLKESDVTAEVTGTTIKNSTGDMTIKANTDDDFSTTAAVAAVGKSAAIGAGVGVTRDETHTTARYSGGSFTGNNFALDAAGHADITTVGVGGGVNYGSGLGLAGSVTVNTIDTETKALINNGANISAKSPRVTAASDEKIANYAGALSIAFQGAAIGASVSVNEIDSETEAAIEGAATKVVSTGSATHSVNDTVKDSDILNDFVDKDAFASAKSLKDARTATKYEGILVDASGTHTMKSFLVNAGGTGTGAAVNGTVNVNLIGGSTKAHIENAAINTAPANKSNVNVIAHDYANSAGLVGTANLSIEGAAAGLGSDTNTVTRTTEAAIVGPSSKYDMYANDLTVEASSRQGVSSLAAGGSIAAEGAGVSAATGVTLLDGATNAFLKNVDIRNAHDIIVSADHLSRTHVFGVVFGGAGIGAGVGIAVGYVDDRSVTEATAGNIGVSFEGNKKYNFAVEANNDLSLAYTETGIGGAGLGAGVAGSIGISESNSTTEANLVNSRVGTPSGRAKTAAVIAQNSMELTQRAGVGSAGAAGVGVGVSVNKLDSTTNANIEISNIYANGIGAMANDHKDVDQMAANAGVGGAAIGLNVMVTNVGKDILASYDAGQGNTMNLEDVFSDVNGAMKAGNLSEQESHGVAGNGGNALTNTRGAVTRAAKAQSSASGLNITGSLLDAEENVNIMAASETNADMKSYAASAGGAAAVNGTVALMDVAGNAVGTIRNTAIDAESGEVTIAAYQNGLSNLTVEQGAVSGTLALTGAYGSVTKTGLTDLLLSGNTVTTGLFSAAAMDESRVKIDALGGSGGIAGSLNVLVGEATNKGKTRVTLDGGNDLSAFLLMLAAERSPKDEENTAEVTTTAVSAAIGVSGAGISATAYDESAAEVNINTNGRANTLEGGILDIMAHNAPKIKTETKSAAGSLLASGAVTLANSSAGRKSSPVTSAVSIGDGTGLDTDMTSVFALTEIGLATDMKGLGVSGFVAGQVNTGRADAYGDSKIALGKFNAKEDGTLTVMSDTGVTKDVKAAGVSAAGLVASGTNVAKSESVLNSTIDAKGTDGKHLSSAMLFSTTSEDNTARAYGDGGAAVDISPYAAKLENSLTTKTTTNVMGAWDASLFVTAADLTDKHSFTTDATRAAIAGGSGVGIANTANHTTAANVSNANVKSDVTQGYHATNTIDYTDTQKAGSYGGVTGSDSAVENTVAATADVNLKGSTLKATEESTLRAEAKTASNIVSKNNVEGAGVVQILVGKTDTDTSFTDRVTVTDSALSTETGDLALTATSNIDHDLEAESVDEGGAAGVTTVKNTNKLTRRDKIDIAGRSKIDSGHDLMLLAGGDMDKMPSDLRLLTYANAHNATFIPAETSPTINETLTLDRGVTVGSSANTSSIRHTYLRADEGSAYIEESARQFEIWGQGERGDRRLTSTALGDSEVSQNKTARVDVQGKVTAGIHNRLDINITGNIFRYGTSAQDAEIDTSGLKIRTAQDWFDVNSSMKSITVKNPYMERYDELLDAMKDYKPDTDEYGLLNRELQNVISAMTAENLVYRDQYGNIALLDEIPVAGISLSDINVSGGNVYVNAATLAGDRNINASGAPQINITNHGNAYMMLGNVKIEEGGGRLYQNDNILREVSGESAINIKSLGIEDVEGISRPDISIEGSVDNLSGAVKITNRTADIGITGAVNGKSVSISADTGAVYLSQPEAFVNVGGDPIAKYMFDETTAAKIQKAISSDFSKANRTSGSKFFKTYNEYRNWIKSVANLTNSEMQYTDWSERNGIIAGGDISINAKDVNINGLIQSGYMIYYNSVQSGDVDAIRKAYAYSGRSGQALSDDDVIGNEQYLVGQSGKSWNNTTKMYDYILPVYYNPYTNHLLTDDIDVRGGRVDIRGHIASTGGGRIVVADGPACISINARGTSADLYVGRITNNDRQGFIRIYDPWGTYGIDESTSAMHRAYKPGEAETTPWEEGKRNGYRPASRSTLRWTGGTSGQKVMDKYYRKYYASFFGLFNLWSYGTTDDLVKNIGSDIKNVRTTTRATNADGTMKQGVVLDERGWQELEDNPDGVYLFLTSYNTGNTTYGKVNASKMRYTNWLHTEGYVDYSWTETSGNSIDTITAISAARPIDYIFAKPADYYGQESGVFIGGDNVYFRDTVESVSNLKYSYNDANAIGVYSEGEIRTLGAARLVTDKLTLDGKSIDARHGAVSGSATIYLTANGGNINFTSDKGNLVIGRAAIDSSPDNGKIAITADGNITLVPYPYLKYVTDETSLADYAYLVSAPAISLTSVNGGIGTSGLPLYVKAGRSATSSNLKNSSLTATARKDIYIQQVDGNMRVAEVKSAEGDVTLTARNGSIVDANGGAYTDDSSAEEKIARWQALGLISDADSDDSRTEAAKASKEKKLAAIEGRFAQLAATEKNGVLTPNAKKVKAYKDAANAYAKDSAIIAARKAYITAMQAADTDAARDAARAKLQAAKDAYFKGRGFSADEQKAIADYGDLSASENYGWSKNELLYAVQNGIVNSQPGVIDIVDTPNVSGKNITLLAPKGGIGYDEAAKYIKNEDITKTENMRLLASARAGDLTWDKDGVTIRRQVPVTLDVAEGGTVLLNGKTNVYVSATPDSALNIKGGIDTDGDIRLSAGKGISISDGTMIRGRNFTLMSGAGDIGSSDKFLEMMVNGWLTANSGKSIYVHQNGNMPLTLLSAAAGMDAYLHADNGIRMYNGYGMDMGYINAGRTVDLYTEQGDIEGVRILANGATVNAAAYAGSVRLIAVGGDLAIGYYYEPDEEQKGARKAAGKIAEEKAREAARKAAEEEISRETLDKYAADAVAYFEYLENDEELKQLQFEIDKETDTLNYLITQTNFNDLEDIKRKGLQTVSDNIEANKARYKALCDKFFTDRGYNGEKLSLMKQYAEAKSAEKDSGKGLSYVADQLKNNGFTVNATPRSLEEIEAQLFEYVKSEMRWGENKAKIYVDNLKGISESILFYMETKEWKEKFDSEKNNYVKQITDYIDKRISLWGFKPLVVEYCQGLLAKDLKSAKAQIAQAALADEARVAQLAQAKFDAIRKEAKEKAGDNYTAKGKVETTKALIDLADNLGKAQQYDFLRKAMESYETVAQECAAYLKTDEMLDLKKLYDYYNGLYERSGQQYYKGQAEQFAKAYQDRVNTFFAERGYTGAEAGALQQYADKYVGKDIANELAGLSAQLGLSTVETPRTQAEIEAQMAEFIRQDELKHGVPADVVEQDRAVFDGQAHGYAEAANEYLAFVKYQYLAMLYNVERANADYAATGNPEAKQYADAVMNSYNYNITNWLNDRFKEPELAALAIEYCQSGIAQEISNMEAQLKDIARTKIDNDTLYR